MLRPFVTGQQTPLWLPSSTPGGEPGTRCQQLEGDTLQHSVLPGTSVPNPYFWVPPRGEPIPLTQRFEELKCCAISGDVGLLRQDQGCAVLSPSRRVDKSL